MIFYDYISYRAPLSEERRSKSMKNPEFQTSSGLFIFREDAKKSVFEQLNPAKSLTPGKTMS